MNSVLMKWLFGFLQDAADDVRFLQLFMETKKKERGEEATSVSYIFSNVIKNIYLGIFSM